MTLRDSRFIKLALLALLVLGTFTLRLVWQSFDSDPLATPSVAYAQGAGEQQYLAPEQQSNGTIVFTGENTDGTINTQPFTISSSTVTITSESNPEEYEPIVFLVDPQQNALASEEEDVPNTYTYNNVDPGEYSLELLTSVPPNVDATFTVTVTEGETTGQEQYDPSETTTPPEDTGDVQYEEDTTDGNPPLMNAGGPVSGPVPVMPSGNCPTHFPVEKDEACYAN